MNKQGKNHVLYYTLSIIGCIVYVALIVSVSLAQILCIIYTEVIMYTTP